MVKVHYQIKPDGSLIPQSEFDRDTLFEKYKANQLVAVEVKGGESARSVPENNLFHSCCKFVAENTEDEQWNTTERVKTQCKMALQFFKDEVWVDDGRVHFVLDSLSFNKTNQVRSHKFISDAMEILALKVNMPVDGMIEIVKSNMRRF